MKKLSLFAITLLSIVMIGCTSGQNSTTASVNADSTTSNVAYNGKIAFIRMDSLMVSYGMFIDMNDEFTKKSQSVQNELMQKGRSIEMEGRKLEEDYQKGSMTRYQVESKAQELQKKQQNLVQYRDSQLAQLQQQEAEMSQKLSNVVKSYLEEYNAQKKYSIILQTVAGSPVIIADPALDITSEVIEGLNQRYKDSLDSQKK